MTPLTEYSQLFANGKTTLKVRWIKRHFLNF